MSPETSKEHLAPLEIGYFEMSGNLSSQEVNETIDDAKYVEMLWNTYYPRMKLAIAGRVKSIRRSVANESEIALSAFNSFVQGTKEGRFPDLSGMDDTWKLLKTIAIRKVNDTRKRLRAQKRGGDHVIVGQADGTSEANPVAGVDLAPARESSPSTDTEVADLLNTMLARLPDDRHRDALLLKLQGASVATIADCLQTTTRTIQRLLKKVEHDWRTELIESSRAS